MSEEIIAILQDKIDDLESQLKTSKDQIRTSREENQSLDVLVEELQKQQQTLQDKQNVIEVQLTKKTKECEDGKKSYDQVKSKLDEANKLVSQLNSQINKPEHNDKIEFESELDTNIITDIIDENIVTPIEITEININEESPLNDAELKSDLVNAIPLLKEKILKLSNMSIGKIIESQTQSKNLAESLQNKTKVKKKFNNRDITQIQRDLNELQKCYLIAYQFKDECKVLFDEDSIAKYYIFIDKIYELEKDLKIIFNKDDKEIILNYVNIRAKIDSLQNQLYQQFDFMSVVVAWVLEENDEKQTKEQIMAFTTMIGQRNSVHRIGNRIITKINKLLYGLQPEEYTSSIPISNQIPKINRKKFVENQITTIEESLDADQLNIDKHSLHLFLVGELKEKLLHDIKTNTHLPVTYQKFANERIFTLSQKFQEQDKLILDFIKMGTTYFLEITTSLEGAYSTHICFCSMIKK